jgi:hypothetical protein
MENIKKKKEERKERKKQFCIESQGLMYMQHRERERERAEPQLIL